MKKIALIIVGFSLLCLVALQSTHNQSSPAADVTALKTEGPCMSRILNKSPQFFHADKCYLG